MSMPQSICATNVLATKPINAAALEKLGYKVQIRDLNSGVQGIVIGKDGLLGGADPRREGKVMGD